MTQPTSEAGLEGQVRHLTTDNAALRQKIEDYERSNAELVQFAYVASHDLRAPLRQIISFGERLRRREVLSGDPEGADALARILGAASRLERLVSDLLSLARVTSSAAALEDVDCAALVGEILLDLDAAGPVGEVEVGPLPPLHADRSQLRQLFANLLGNALKFRDRERPSRIRVLGREREDGFAEVTVEDNGIGFEERFLDRIFKPFQRLHGRGAYEGSGMGLAICQKIAMRHGGWLSARSRPGLGSAFTLVLPQPRRAGGTP